MKEDEFVPGLMHVSLGGYHVRDIEFTAAFDVNHTKVGKDLSEAIFAEPKRSTRMPAGAPVSAATIGPIAITTPIEAELSPRARER